jgi:hypothetical protein
MSEEKIFIATNKSELRDLINEVIASKSQEIKQPDIENDRISKAETAKLISRSLPYVNKLIKSGILRDYGFGKRGKYLLKSEVLEALRNSTI